MTATEAKNELGEIWRSTDDENQKSALWIAIRAIDTCNSNGFVIE